jgi:hypothetical protein
MPELRARFAYTPALAKRAYLGFVWARQPVAVCTSPLILLLGIAFWRSTEYAFLGGFFLGLVFLLWISWAGGWSRAGQVAAALGSPEVEWIASESSLVLRTAQVETRMAWSAVFTLHRTRRFWVLMRPAVSGFVFAPVDALSEEFRSFLEGRVRVAGGRVR